MSCKEIFPQISLFFTQILDIVPQEGIILSYEVMQKIKKCEIQKLLENVNMQLIKFEKHGQIQIYVLSRFEQDQIWIVKYLDKTVLMLSSDY